MRLFLGVDGGQSGTTAMIGDETGRILGTGAAGPCNHAAHGEGRGKLERAVVGSVGAACAQAGLDVATVCFEAGCFGMSGGPDDKREILASILRVDRLVVTNELKLRGIDYLLVFDTDNGADDLRLNTDLWGLRAVGDDKGMRLYQLL